MIYSEAAYFPDEQTGKRNHCQHCADRDETKRLERIRELNRRGALAHVRSTVGMI